MGIPCQCDICGKKYLVKSNRAGAQIGCKECGTPIEVPGERSDDDIWDAEELIEHEPRRTIRRPVGRSRRGLPPRAKKWTAIGSTVATAAFVIWLLMYLTGSFTTPDWQPDPELLAELDLEIGHSGYSVRVPASFELVQSERIPSRLQLVWQVRPGGPEAEAEFRLDVKYARQYHPKYKPKIITTNRPFVVSFGGGDTYVKPGAKVDRNVLSGQQFTRIRKEPVDGDTAYFYYLGYAESFKIEMYGEVRGAADDRMYRLMETVARTFRNDSTTAMNPIEVQHTVAANDAQRHDAVSHPALSDFSQSAISNAAANPQATVPKAFLQTDEKRLSGSSSSGSGSVWGDESKLQILLEKKEPTFAKAPFPSPFLLVDQVIYDTEMGETVWDLTAASWAEPHIVALNSRGTLLAMTTADYRRAEQPEIAILDCEAGGQELSRFSLPGPLKFPSFQFISDDRLLTICQRGRQKVAMIWNVDTGRPFREIRLESFVDKFPAVSRDGRYLAAYSTEEFLVYDIQRNRRAARMADPPYSRQGGLMQCEGLAFCPETEELAAVFFGGRLVCWSSKGEIVFDGRLDGIHRAAPKGRGLQWLPDKSGWWIHGQFLVDRACRQVLWEVRSPIFHPKIADSLIDSEHVLIVRGSPNSMELVDVPIPWQQIRSTLDHMESDSEAVLKPGQRVSIRLQIGQVRFSSRDAMMEKLGAALAGRLQESGITVEPGRPVAFYVHYSESAGDTKRVVEQFNRDTGQRVQDTIGRLQIELRGPDTDKPIWQTNFQSDGGTLIDGPVTDGNLRNQMVESLLLSIQRMDMPYYIPKDASVPRLPIVTDWSH
jgi:hypothetical protein